MLYVALETEFILALYMGEDFALGAIDAITRARAYPLVPPSVIAELEWQARHLKDEALRGTAANTLVHFANYNFLTPSLSSTQRDVSEINAKKLVASGVYDCYQSALVITEAAALNCRIMLTYSLRTRTPEELQSLKLHLLAADLADCMPMPPDVFVRHFGTPPTA